MTKRLLIIEDDQRLADNLAQEFRERGYEVVNTTSVRTMPSDATFDFALIDLRLDGDFGLEAILPLKAKSPNCRIVIFSGYASVSTAVESVKRGATDYLMKPASVDEIEAALLGKRAHLEPDLENPSLARIEHEYIDFVLTRNGGNISRSAKDLGIHRQSLQRKLKKYT